MGHPISPRSAGLAILAIFLLSGSTSAQITCVARDNNALLAFKAGLNDFGDQLSSWNSAANCCSFVGVTCNAQGEVISLNYEADVETDCEENCRRITSISGGPNDANLIGTTLSKLLALEVLNLTAFIIEDVTPTGLSALKNLRVLALQRTRLQGPISDDIGKITSLRYLSISNGNDDVSGPIPTSLCNLVNLQTLLLSENFGTGRTGAIPSCIGQLQQLETFEAERNSLTGRLPAAIKTLKKLKSFKVTLNKLNMALLTINPGELPALKLFYIQGNDFTGSIPSSFGNLLALEDLRIGGTEDGTATLVRSKLTGSIPSTLGKLTKLKVLIIRGGVLNGAIPTPLADLPVLSELQLQDNQLTGPIPTNLGKSGILKTLNLAKNKLTGPIPPQFQTFPASSFTGNPGMCGPPLANPC